MNTLSGKNVLVTGASSGFGEAIALQFSQAGAHVALVARREEMLRALAQRIEPSGVRTLVCPCDVGDEAQVRATVDKIDAEFGPIDVLVNNAGTNVPNRTIVDTTTADFHAVVDVNLVSAFLFTSLLLPQMKERGAGTIINIASRAANFPSLLAGVAYSSAKMAMKALNQITNEEGNPHGVRACVINPGVAATPLLDRRPVPPPQETRHLMMQAEDIAATVLYAASLPQRANADRIDLYATSTEVY
ncbi:MAG: SDR family NAD(P)-dependent oxidoreductase [Caldilineaceae bacterium]|nr:SDR family NAD(P)-dependent oxidoreductase [Caldilineaceae bacterium]